MCAFVCACVCICGSVSLWIAYCLASSDQPKERIQLLQLCEGSRGCGEDGGHLKEIDTWGLRWRVWGKVMLLEMMGGAGQKVPGGPENLVASIRLCADSAHSALVKLWHIFNLKAFTRRIRRRLVWMDCRCIWMIVEIPLLLFWHHHMLFISCISDLIM